MSIYIALFESLIEQITVSPILARLTVDNATRSRL